MFPHAVGPAFCPAVGYCRFFVRYVLHVGFYRHSSLQGFLFAHFLCPQARGVVERVAQHPISWTKLRKVLTMLGGSDIDNHALVIGVTTEMLRDVLNVLAGRVTKRVLLHAYSGRRRSGDLQCYLEAIEVPDGLVCHVISLDIVVSETHGNIMVSSGYGVLEADGMRNVVSGA